MPKTVDVDQRRQDITNAAARLIARSGIGAATMRDVAAEGGWTTGVVTHYFADKRELLISTLEASLRGRRHRRSDREQQGPSVALRASLVSALPTDEASRRHWMVTVAFCAEAGADKRLAAVQRDAYREFRSYVAMLVGEMLSVDNSAATRIAEQLIAFVDGIAMQALFDPQSWPGARQMSMVDEQLDRVVRKEDQPNDQSSDQSKVLTGR